MEIETQQFLFDYQEYLANHEYFTGWLIGVKYYFENDKETILYFKQNEDSRYRRFTNQKNPDVIEKTIRYVLATINNDHDVMPMPTNITTNLKTGEVNFS